MSKFLLEAEKRPSSELRDEFGIAKPGPRPEAWDCPRAPLGPSHLKCGPRGGRRGGPEWGGAVSRAPRKLQIGQASSLPSVGQAESSPGILGRPRRELGLHPRGGGQSESRFRVSRPAPTWACAFRAGERSQEPRLGAAGTGLPGR